MVYAFAREQSFCSIKFCYLIELWDFFIEIGIEVKCIIGFLFRFDDSDICLSFFLSYSCLPYIRDQVCFRWRGIFKRSWEASPASDIFRLGSFHPLSNCFPLYFHSGLSSEISNLKKRGTERAEMYSQIQNIILI